MKEQNSIPFEQVLEALTNPRMPFPDNFIAELSDLSPKNLHLLTENWVNIPVERRQNLLTAIEALTMTDFVLSFSGVCQLALSDSNEKVRLRAIRSLTALEDKRLIPQFTQILEQDESKFVRAEAANGLSNAIYLGEMEEIPKSDMQRIENLLISILRGDEQKLVKRRALEAIGFSSSPAIPAIIENAYQSGDQEWLVSALKAMGRSANRRRWQKDVLAELDHPSADVREEAARAAGHLNLKASQSSLIENLNDPDSEVRHASIWALSEIGGEGTREALQEYQKELDITDDEFRYLEEALENLDFNDDLINFMMLEYNEDEDLQELLYGGEEDNNEEDINDLDL